ncbi:phosphoribosylanthranilate isomerase [Paenibacillus gansuensis]|uniref:N-(5'-phosphoribosyl)anthranilate isomerase n=1 Tax=Paenibacillus gansuensis TaxID=306542 RepID=A0ABW5PBS0_9BACL
MKKSGVLPAAKICGLQSVEVLKSILHLPIDYIGFVFAKSRRQVTPAQAGECIRFMREQQSAALAAGVFVNPALEDIGNVLAEARLDVIQLHGQETPEFCAEVREHFNILVYKAFPVKESTERDGAVVARLDAYAGAVDGMLIDTYDPVQGGGTGETFAWEAIPAYTRWAEEHHLPLLVAGGLHAGNVGELLQRYDVYGVDVSSGVETDGVKDPAKISAFIERVKQL